MRLRPATMAGRQRDLNRPLANTRMRAVMEIGATPWLVSGSGGGTSQSLGSFKEAVLIRLEIVALPISRALRTIVGVEIDLLASLGAVYTFTQNFADARRKVLNEALGASKGG